MKLDAQLLKLLMPEVTLRQGSIVAARVIERSGQRGLLSLAGRTLEASLPEGLVAGQSLRLEVQEATPERVVLRLTDPGAPPPPALALPLPDGREALVRVNEEEAEGAEREGTPSISLSYESPALGRLDLRLELPAGAVSATVHAAAGRPADAAEAASAELRAALQRASGRPAQVSVKVRHGPFDAYA